MEFRAYITNLGKYNEGELVGKWVDFPIDEEDFEEVLHSIGVSNEPDEDGNYYEEWFVTDYECDLDAFDWQDLGEYPSYETLNEFGELLEEVDDEEAINNAYEVTGNLQEAIDGLERGDIYYYPGIDSYYDLGEYIVDYVYGEITPDMAGRYFDFEALGRDLGFDSYEDDNGEYVDAGTYWCGDEDASDEEIGEAFVFAVGDISGVSNPDNYFDYAQFGRDLSFDGFTFTSDGVIEYR